MFCPKAPIHIWILKKTERVDKPAPEADEPEAAEAGASGPERDDDDLLDDEEHGGRFSRFTRRLLEPGDGRKVLSAMWETSDRAKTEAVRMVAREVRQYLDALELKEDLLDLVRSHSLEINASLRLKPLPEATEGDDEDGSR